MNNLLSLKKGDIIGLTDNLVSQWVNHYSNPSIDFNTIKQRKFRVEKIYQKEFLGLFAEATLINKSLNDPYLTDTISISCSFDFSYFEIIQKSNSGHPLTKIFK